MSKFMKTLNNISRSQAIYRHNRISVSDLQSGHYAYLLTICKNPGLSQEDVARELCVNKSTVTRNLDFLEQNQYVLRKSLPNNKRQFSLFPTEKALTVLPKIKEASAEWMTLLSQGIKKDELEIFHGVLRKMEEKARAILEMQGAEK